MARYDPGIDYRLVEGSGDPVCNRFLGASRKYTEPEREARSSKIGKYFVAYWVRVGSDAYVIIQTGRTIGERFGEVVNVCTYINSNDVLNPSSGSLTLTTSHLDDETSELLSEVVTLARSAPATAVSFDSIVKVIRAVNAGRPIVRVESRAREHYLSYVKLLAVIASVTNDLLLSNAKVSNEVQSKLSDLAVYTISSKAPTETYVGSDLTSVSKLLTRLILIRGTTLINKIANILNECPSKLYELLLDELAGSIVAKYSRGPALRTGLVQERRTEFDVVRYVRGEKAVKLCMRGLRESEAEFIDWASKLLRDLGYVMESEYCLSTYGRLESTALKVVFRGGLERIEGVELPTLSRGAGIYDVPASKDGVKYLILYYESTEELEELSKRLRHALIGYEGVVRDVRGYVVVNYRERSRLLGRGTGKGLALIIKEVGEGIYDIDQLEIIDEYREVGVPCLRATKARSEWDLNSLASIIVEDSSDTNTSKVLLIKPVPKERKFLVRIFKRSGQPHQHNLLAPPH